MFRVVSIEQPIFHTQSHDLRKLVVKMIHASGRNFFREVCEKTHLIKMRALDAKVSAPDEFSKELEKACGHHRNVQESSFD